MQVLEKQAPSLIKRAAKAHYKGVYYTHRKNVWPLVTSNPYRHLTERYTWYLVFQLSHLFITLHCCFKIKHPKIWISSTNSSMRPHKYQEAGFWHQTLFLTSLFALCGCSDFHLFGMNVSACYLDSGIFLSFNYLWPWLRPHIVISSL